jgi:hypothetical protein
VLPSTTGWQRQQELVSTHRGALSSLQTAMSTAHERALSALRAELEAEHAAARGVDATAAKEASAIAADSAVR